MWLICTVLLFLSGAPHGHALAPTVDGAPAQPTHTCRVILRGTAVKPFALAEFRLECCPGATLCRPPTAGNAAAGGTGAGATVTVRLGESLLNYVNSMGAALTLAGVRWTLPRPMTSLADSGDHYNDGGDTSAGDSGGGRWQGCNPSQQLCDDWGIDILDVPHLHLVDSELSDVPLSNVSPLLQCLNCSGLTVQNLTLRNLQRPTAADDQQSATDSSPTTGAVRATGLWSSTLEGVRCSGVSGAFGWACVLLQTRAGATTIIRNSVFENNVLDDNGYQDAKLSHGSRRLMEVEGSPVQYNPPTSGVGAGPGSRSDDVLPPQALQCTAGTCFTSTWDAQPGYGAVLIATFLEGYDCFHLGSSSVLVEGTILTNNTGGCGAGMSIIATTLYEGSCDAASVIKRNVSLRLVNTTFSGNTASMNGGGLHICDAYTAGMDVSTSGGSSLSNNTAGQHGGAAAVQGSCIGEFLINDTNVFANAANGWGGGLYINPGSSLSSLIINGSSLSWNHARDSGGAAYVRPLNGKLHGITLSGASTLDSNEAGSKDGGAIYLEATMGSLPEINVTGQTSFSNNTAFRNGGAMHIERSTLGAADADPNSGQRIFLHDAFFLNNTALTGNGGALCVRHADGNVSVLSVSGSSFIDNMAACNGGAMALELWASDQYVSPFSADGIVKNITIAARSTFANNLAAGKFGKWTCPLNVTDKQGEHKGEYEANGGAIFLGVNGVRQPLTITGGSSYVNNTAWGSGGAIYAAETSAFPGILITGGSEVSHNRAGYRGGFMFFSASNVSREKTVFIGLEGVSTASHNTAGFGGFLYAGAVEGILMSIHVAGSKVVNNSAINGTGGALNVADAGFLDLSIDNGSIFTLNRATGEGGAVWVAARQVKAVRISGASFTGNQATTNGGGMLISDTDGGVTRILIDGRSHFEDNSAQQGNGGAICVKASVSISDVSVTGDSLFANNQAGSNGGAIALSTGGEVVAPGYIKSLRWDGGSVLSNNHAIGKGGGIYMTSVISVDTSMAGRSQWDGNTAGGDGGALYIDASRYGVVAPFPACRLVVTGGSRLQRNSAQNGGAVFVNGFMQLTVSGGSTIESNTAEYNGGAAALTQLPPSLRLESCSITGNIATLGSGGAFHLTTAQPWLPANAPDRCPNCALSTVQVDLLNATIGSNTAATADGGAFFIKPHETCCSSTNIVINFLSSQFTQNKAMGVGGAMAMFDTSNASARISINSTDFTGNTAGIITGDFTTSVNFGGAIIIWRQPTDVSRNLTSLCQLHAAGALFQGNSCNGGSGGAITLIACSAQFSGCNFTSNRATLSGGAVASMHVPRTTATLGLTPSSRVAAPPSGSSSQRRRRLQEDVAHLGVGRVAGISTHLARALLDWQRWDDDESQPRSSVVAHSRRKLSSPDVYPTWYDSCFSSPNWFVNMLGCNFRSNYADLEFGGGLYLYASTDAGEIRIDGSTFTDNKAFSQHAGAAFLAAKGVGTTMQLTNSVFDGNTAEAASSGALYTLLGQHACGALSNVSLTRNRAAMSGGACMLDVRSNGTLDVMDVDAASNAALAADGGAVLLQVQTGGRASVTGCSFDNNQAGGNGGAALLDGSCGSYVSLQASNMTHNQAGRSGGALYASYATSSTEGNGGGAGAGSSSTLGFSPAAMHTTAASPCPDMPASPELQRMSIQKVDFRANSATEKGGAVFIAPMSAVVMSNLTMDNNTACGGGGSLAGQGCAALALSYSTIHNSYSAGSGGGFYAGGCSRVLLEFVNVSGNGAAAAGGGLMVSGGSGEDVNSNISSNTSMEASAAGLVSGSYTSMVLHRVRVAGNAVGSSSSSSATRKPVGGCEVDSSTLQQTVGRVGMGGGLFIAGAVAGVLSRSDLTQPNDASFGSSVATTQRCYPVSASNVSTLTGQQQQGLGPEEVALWSRAWAELDQLAARQCWVLQLSDTLVPPLVASATTKDLPIWVDDFLASSLQATCSDEYQPTLQFTNDAASSNAALDTIRSNVVWRRLADTRKRVQNTALFSAGQVLPLVRDGAVSAPAAVTSKLKTQRLKDLANALDTCVAKNASANNLTTTEAVNAALRVMPYIGLPATYIALPRNTSDPRMPPAGNVQLQLQTGVAFNLTAQLYDMLQQKVTADMGSATVTLALRPRPPGGGPYNATAADGSTPWLDPTIGLLDAGMDRSLTVPVVDGTATWFGVKAYAWPGHYSLVLNLSSTISSFVKVASLETEIEILPCAVGETLELSQTSYKATWTGCKMCPSGQYGLWADNRQALTDVTSGDGVGGLVGSSGRASTDAAGVRELRILDDMNNTIHADDYSSCKTCPLNALCLGGAVIVPLQGYWHSSANSTQIHSCPNAAACRSPKDDTRARFPRWLDDKMGGEWDQRTKLLAWCQLAWYDSVVPGSAVTAQYWARHRLDEDGAAAAPPSAAEAESGDLAEAVALQNGTALLNGGGTLSEALLASIAAAGETYTDCLLFGLPPWHPDAYMQQLCQEGYSGNLCAACSPGYYVDSDFNCKRCPELARTIALGLVSFFSSVILVLFTTLTNFTEGFGQRKRRWEQQQQQQQQQQGGYGRHEAAPSIADAAPKDPVELGDVVKVIVLHLQYLIIVTRLSVDYPTIIVRCQAVFSAITGAENYIVYSPSCLKPDSDSGGQALIQWLAAILTPCAVSIVSMIGWTIWYVCRGGAGKKPVGEVIGDGLRSARDALLGGCKGLAARCGRCLSSGGSSRGSGIGVATDSQSACGSASEGSAAAALAACKTIEYGNMTAGFWPLPPLNETLPPDGQLDDGGGGGGGGGIGLCSHYRDVLHVVSFDAMDGGGAVAGSPTAAITASAAVASAASPCSPPTAANPDFFYSAAAAASSPQQPQLLTPQKLPTAASAAMCVDLHGVEEGAPAEAPEPASPDASSPDHPPPAVSILPEDGKHDHEDDDLPDGIPHAGACVADGVADGVGFTAASPAGGAPPALGHAYSRYMSVRWDAPEAVLQKGSFSTAAGGCAGDAGGGYPGGQYYHYSPYSQAQYQRTVYANEMWYRRSGRAGLSHMRSAAFNDAIKDKLHKLKSLAVTTQQTSQQTFSQVDRWMNLREQLGVVLMAAVFILYPSWAHAALSTFACFPIDDGTGPFPSGQQATWLYGFWVRDMQMQCYSGTHLRVYVPIGVAAVLVFCVLPPLLSFMFVWRVRKRLNEEHVRKVYGFLYKRYKPRYIWWETALQLETLILVTVEVLGRGLNVSYQALLLLAVFTVIALINVSCAPLVSRLLVIMEFMSLGTLSLTITLSLYFTIDDGLNPAAENTLAILIILLNTFLMAWFLYIASRHYWPSAVKKVAPKAHAVLRKLSSIGSSTGNQHHPHLHGKLVPPDAAIDGDSPQGRRACWPVPRLLGRLLPAACWRGTSPHLHPHDRSDCCSRSASEVGQPHPLPAGAVWRGGAPGDGRPSYSGCSEGSSADHIGSDSVQRGQLMKQVRAAVEAVMKGPAGARGSGDRDVDFTCFEERPSSSFGVAPLPLVAEQGSCSKKNNREMGQVHIQLEDGGNGGCPAVAVAAVGEAAVASSGGSDSYSGSGSGSGDVGYVAATSGGSGGKITAYRAAW